MLELTARGPFLKGPSATTLPAVLGPWDRARPGYRALRARVAPPRLRLPPAEAHTVGSTPPVCPIDQQLSPAPTRGPGDSRLLGDGESDHQTGFYWGFGTQDSQPSSQPNQSLFKSCQSPHLPSMRARGVWGRPAPPQAVRHSSGKALVLPLPPLGPVWRAGVRREGRGRQRTGVRSQRLHSLAQTGAQPWQRKAPAFL